MDWRVEDRKTEPKRTVFSPRHVAYTMATWHGDGHALVRISLSLEGDWQLLPCEIYHTGPGPFLCFSQPSWTQPPLLTLVQALIFLPLENKGNTYSLCSRRGSVTMLYPEASALGICKQWACTSSFSLSIIHVHCLYMCNAECRIFLVFISF